MNRLQRIFLVCGLAGIALLCLCPPWQYEKDSLVPSLALRVVENGDHGFVFRPPLKLPAWQASPTRMLIDLGPAPIKTRQDPNLVQLEPPPTAKVRSDEDKWVWSDWRPQIDFARLGLEAGAVAGVAAIAVVLAGYRKKAKPSN